MNITLSQVALVAALVLFVVYVFRVRSDSFDRLVYLACAAAGIVLVIDPQLSTRIANTLGIGRGADLIFYLAIIMALFYGVASHSRTRRLERQITLLVRQQAIQHPVKEEGQAAAEGRRLTR
jgi:small membrane protein